MPPLPPTADAFLLHCLAEAVAAVQPTRAIGSAALPAIRGAPWILAVGKAAPGMADALSVKLAARGTPVAGGLVVAPEGSHVAEPPLLQTTGDHPFPGGGSFAAAALLERVIALIPTSAEVHVALSGGTSALLAAPVPGVSESELEDTFALLFRSGAPIGVVNAARRRLLRWGNGRLAAALAPRPVTVWVISDVPDDQLTDVGSGPCAGDPMRGVSLRDLLEPFAEWDALAASVQAALCEEGPAPGDPVFRHVEHRLVASNATAKRAAAAAAARFGISQSVADVSIAGEAREVGRALALEAMHVAREWERQNQALHEDGHGDAVRPRLLVWGGECTVAVGDSAGIGGRAQELALAAAEMLEVSPLAVTLLAAGTDGRDGPTDAAGAIVDSDTWERLGTFGDPSAALLRHDAYPLLNRAGVLIRSGATGTNVMDLVLAVVGWGAESETG